MRIRGTVVLRVRDGHVFNIHDGVECLAVHCFKAPGFPSLSVSGRALSDLGPGEMVEIEGVTDPAAYVPVVVPTAIRVLGRAEIPLARRVGIERLLSGVETSQWVTVEGVVRTARESTTETVMEIMGEGQLCEVRLQEADGIDPQSWLDARVCVTGCASVIFNLRAEAIGLRMLVQDPGHIEVVRPPPADPFQAPRVRLKSLIPYSRSDDRFYRKVTQGVVNYIMPGGFFYIQEGDAGVRVDAPEAIVKVGDLVEVSGFVDTSRGIASMAGAVARRLGPGVLPPPRSLALARLFHPRVANPLEPVAEADYFGSLIRLEGIVRSHEQLLGGNQARLVLDADGSLFDAHIAVTGQTARDRWPEGSRVTVSGVCEPRFESTVDELGFPRLAGFTLWSRTANDITVLHSPSWWTPARLSLALCGSLAVLALSLAWSTFLRRQVNRQMAIISDQLRGEAVSEERNRMARDLHDTLEQMLAGVSLQLDDVEETLRGGDGAALQSVDRARRMLEFTRTEARRSVWDLRSQVLERHGLATAIRTMAEASRHACGPAVECKVTGTPADLSPTESYNLLHMCQEALANALKHAAASRIEITLGHDDQQVRLEIADNGVGFPSGMLDRSDKPHFGVLGMRERAVRVGATLLIQGQPGRGCRVSINLPR